MFLLKYCDPIRISHPKHPTLGPAYAMSRGLGQQASLEGIFKLNFSLTHAHRPC